MTGLRRQKSNSSFNNDGSKGVQKTSISINLKVEGSRRPSRCCGPSSPELEFQVQISDYNFWQKQCIYVTLFLTLQPIDNDIVHAFVTKVYCFYFQQDNALSYKAQITSNGFLQHDNEFTAIEKV